MRNAEKMVAEETDANFDLRKCKGTFGQNKLEDGLSLNSISVRMGQSSTKITEKYYYRKRTKE